VTSIADTLGVVFVNFHSEALILPRVATLVSAGHAVRVADNSASYPDETHRVDTGANIGFGAACNRAVEALPASITTICFHNPDVSLPVADIRRLVSELRSHRDPGACSPSIRVGSMVRTNGFHYPGVLRELAVAMRATSFQRTTRKYAAVGDRERRVSGRGRRFGSGALIVIDRQAFEAVSGFDERYFMYGEDLDLWHRIATSGRSTGFLPDVVADHRSGSGSPATGGTRELLRWTGVELFAATHMGGAWTHMRRAHRLLLGRLNDVSPSLLETVSESWSRSATPEETSTAIRDLFSNSR